MAWAPESRMVLSTLRKQGVVAVQYRKQGCDVSLELLPDCIGAGSYTFEPYSHRDTKTASNVDELYAQFPLGAARLAGKLSGNRALRTDFVFVGMGTLPAGTIYQQSDLKGPGCDRATHVIRRIYLGGFAMEAGEERVLQAQGNVFLAGAGATHQAGSERITFEGTPEACQRALQTGHEEPLCSVPVKIGLLSIEGAGKSVCPEGTRWNGHHCEQKSYCPAGSTWDGTRCMRAAATAPAATAPAATAPAATAPAATAPAATTTTSGRGPAMARIPGGEFWMGSNDGGANERDAHRVSVAAFELDVTEVTVAQYGACVTAGDCAPQSSVNSPWYDQNGGAAKWSAETCIYGEAGRDNHPMNCVDWENAGAFCRWAGKRLPTEEEWEYVARGTDGRTYPWGNEAPTAARLNACGSECASFIRTTLGLSWLSMYPMADSWPTTAPVASYAPTLWGLYDLAGNVWEWTETQYCDSYKPGANCNNSRVVRGGGWLDGVPSDVRAAFRFGFDPSYRFVSLGFRCARP
jgi:sulfatase modifying factor 1